MESGFSPCKILLFWQRATNPTCICLKFTLFPQSVMVVWGEVTGAISTRKLSKPGGGPGLHSHPALLLVCACLPRGWPAHWV